MAKLTVENLGQLRDRLRSENALREEGPKVRITVHMGTCGIASGADKVMDALKKEISDSDRKDIFVTTSGCMGLCSREPLVTIECIGQDPVKYEYMDADRMRTVFREHVLNGKVHLPFALARGREISD
jgi:NADP-reducing hydrogenase subunit HndB